MQRGRGRRDDIFGAGDPFSAFGGFGRPGSLISSFFGGRDPFDDPFFTQPFGGLMSPSMLRPGGLMPPRMFGPSLFDIQGNLFGETSNAGFLEQTPTANKSKGPIIRELSDDEEEGGEPADTEKKVNPRKHSRSSKEPLVQDPDEVVEEKRIRRMEYKNHMNQSSMMQPQSHSFTFQSSTMTYGGINGAYYTSSTARRMGGDGVVMEESKEADSTTGRATHRISRGIREKGHSLTRKLNPDGKVDTMQVLHNLNEGELPVFEEAWKGNAKQHLPGRNSEINLLDGGIFRSGSNSRQEQSRRLALPSTEQPHDLGKKSQTKSFKTRDAMKQKLHISGH